ncbi:hypothetical protein P691DRAFT_766245 [Macrolepiota fuliginosa MF-IS2]|uniref:Uncharacterized protein n=1 Tax=Macrolepiota fuliginosa MF-IS2 TaxID=1400762 RepID=A0A9P6BW42_9AGAR|nr:hypothetical protein P691DRAFT_766245 [Macrolepiota fuliginosa MF-IS2]
MAHKPRMKATASDPKLSNTTVAFLNAQNQDLHARSIMQMSLLITLPELAQVQVCCELNAISFTYEAPTLSLPPPEIPKEEEDSTNEEMDIHLFNDMLTSLLIWIGKDGFNNKPDCNAHDGLIKCIFKLAKVFNLMMIITLPTPPPPPPCTQPHSDEEDVHMEPPTPAHVFSEAASQTPAPLPMVAMPPPPPLPVTSTTPIPVMPTLSKPGPLSRPSFAEAAVRTLCPTAPPFVPSRQQFFIETSAAAGLSLLGLVDQANNALSHTKSPLHIDSACLTSSGTTCATASIPTQSDLNIVEAMLPPKISGSQVTLPTSQSFIKLIDIPYFMPGTTKLPNGQEIGDQLISSPIPTKLIEHA